MQPRQLRDLFPFQRWQKLLISLLQWHDLDHYHADKRRLVYFFTGQPARLRSNLRYLLHHKVDALTSFAVTETRRRKTYATEILFETQTGLVSHHTHFGERYAFKFNVARRSVPIYIQIYSTEAGPKLFDYIWLLKIVIKTISNLDDTTAALGRRAVLKMCHCQSPVAPLTAHAHGFSQWHFLKQVWRLWKRPICKMPKISDMTLFDCPLAMTLLKVSVGKSNSVTR